MLRFIHAADIHLDSPLLNLEQYEGAPVDVLRTASRQALERLVDLAIQEGVAFVLIAGDVWDGNWDDTRTGLHFNRQMTRLKDANIPVYVIAGNHDAANKMTYNLRLPDNVKYFSVKGAESIELPDVGVRIHGQGFAKAAVTDNLAMEYPKADPGAFNIGLLHTCATGSGHERYAPCSIDDLRSRGYQYWALGHIHQRDVLCRDPLIAFPGNVQGRHIREPGAKGCLLVTVDNSGRTSEEFRPLDVIRWETCHVDLSGAARADQLLDTFRDELTRVRAPHDGMPLALRVEITGATAAHDHLAAKPRKWSDEIRSTANEHAGGEIWIEKVKFHTRPAAELDLSLLDGPLGELHALLAELAADDARLAALGGQLVDLKRKLPSEFEGGADMLPLDDPRQLRELLDSVGPLLVARLSAGQ